MSIFGSSVVTESFDDNTMNAIVEQFLVDDITHNWSVQQVQEFCAAGGYGEALVEAKVLGKRTMVRLSKMDDFARRSTIAAMQLAKNAKDPLFDKLALNRVKEKELLNKIRNKYANKASKLAKEGQKKYIKTMKKVPASFMAAGGAERV